MFNMSGVFTNNMTIRITLKRTEGGVLENTSGTGGRGFYKKDTKPVIIEDEIKATVYQATPQDLQYINTGSLYQDYLTVLTPTELRVASDKKKHQADKLIIDGEEYTVISVTSYQTMGKYTQAIVGREVG